jgi:hypothetical protein
VENQPPQGSPISPGGAPLAASTAPVLGPSSTPPFPTPATPSALPSGEWPTVPPAPALVKPDVPIDTPEPPVLVAPAPAVTATETDDVELLDGESIEPVTGPVLSLGAIADESPTVNIPAGQAATPTSPSPIVPPPRRARGVPTLSPYSADESPVVALQRSVRRQQAYARNPREDLVWQPRFAYSSALIILLALIVVSLPLWLVLYRISDPLANNGAGPKVADLMALCMMLLGGFLTGAAAWVIIIEMRGRVRMVDTLAKTGEREAMAAPEIPVLDAPLESFMAGRTGAGTGTGDAESVPLAARIEAQQVSAAATLEASSKLLSSFSSVLRSFGQLPAQVAMLAVALALFVGATVLSLN